MLNRGLANLFSAAMDRELAVSGTVSLLALRRAQPFFFGEKKSYQFRVTNLAFCL